MARHGICSRPSRSIGVMIGAVAAAFLPAGLGAAQPSGPGVPAGDWDGWLTFVAMTPDGTSVAGTGGFAMQSDDSRLTGEAAWAFDTALSTGRSARADVSAIVQGASSAPQLQLTSIVVDGSDVPINRTDPPNQLSITTVSCEVVTGTSSGVGAALLTSGQWLAVRDGSLSDDATVFGNDLAELIVQIESIEVDLLAGAAFDRSSLFAAILASEQMSQALSRSPECGGPFGAHGTVAVGLIADLLANAIEAGDVVDTRSFIDIVLAGVEVGAIGASTSADGLELDVLAEIQLRIDGAIAARDAESLRQLTSMAYQLGYRSLADAATAGLEDIGA